MFHASFFRTQSTLVSKLLQVWIDSCTWRLGFKICLLKGGSVPIFFNIGWWEHSKTEVLVLLPQTLLDSQFSIFISKTKTQEPLFLLISNLDKIFNMYRVPSGQKVKGVRGVIKKLLKNHFNWCKTARITYKMHFLKLQTIRQRESREREKYIRY